jgi:hypothetical protein
MAPGRAHIEGQFGLPFVLQPGLEERYRDWVFPSRLRSRALEGHRAGRLSEYQIQQLLGFEYFEEAHRFFNEHSVYPPYSMDDVEQDTAVALDVALRARAEHNPNPPH